MDAAERIIVALDMPEREALDLARELKGSACWLKVGMTLYYSAGPQVVRRLKQMGYKVFVDLKLHDIPHQVRGAAASVVAAGADMLSVHAAGGREMMLAAAQGVAEGFARAGGKATDAVAATKANEGSVEPEPSKPICIAISVLTSMDDANLQETGLGGTASEQVERLALLARKSGMDGLVCSPQEAARLRALLGQEAIIVTPGVRPASTDHGDQKRTATPATALENGADFLVIGRPITAAAHPLDAFRQILEETKL